MQSRLYSKSLLVALVIGLAFVSMMPGVFAAPAAEQAESNEKIKDLLQKRLATATEIHNLSLKAFKGGQFQFERVLKARAAMLRAQLDLAETKQDRIKVHEEMVKAAEAMLEIMKKLAKGNQVSQVDVLEVELQLLEVKIGLEKAKAAK